MIEEFKEIHWKEVLGNVYSRALSHSMLHPIGDKHFSVTPVVKGARKDKKKVWVKYDRHYVTSFIAKKIIEKLQPITKEHLIEVISEAWDAYEELKH
jgi:hypothetical protein